MHVKGTRLPPDWSPDPSLLAWAKGRRPDLDMTDVVESFRDFWLSKPGQGATKLDWNATFRNWVRNTRGPYWQRTAPVPVRPAPTTQPRSSRKDGETKVARLGAFLADMFGKAKQEEPGK